MILQPGTTEFRANGTHQLPRVGRPLWRRGRLLLVLMALLLVSAVVLVVNRSQSAAPPPPLAVAAPLVAHGQVMPARQAHVGTQSGGVVQRLDVGPGDQVTAQTPLALVVGASGTELVTAPFGGTITNVLVHAGDTLIPGATIAIVADLHSLQVETSDIDEFLVTKVAIGQRVQLNIDALDNLAMTGVVASIALLPQTGSSGGPAYPVVISVGGFPPEVHAGMSVRVTLPEAQSP
jgi:multidrug efflux pump subunit AcrA (membrane-fusion protein)